MNKLQHLQFLGRLGNQGGKKPAWTPSRLSGLALWLDAADASTITLNGSTVSQWNDKSGNNRNVTQATAANQPTYNSAQFNGKPTLRFDGSNDILSNPSVGAAGLTSVTIISVFRMLSTANTDVLMGIGPTGTIGTVRSLFRASTTVGFAGWSNDVPSSSFSYDVGGSPHIFATWNTKLNTPDNVRINRDGATPTVHTTNSGNLNTTLNGFSVGSLQGSLVDNYYTNMDVGEVVVLYSAVNDTDRQLIEGYLAWKWGLQANLPAGHPYKNAAP